MGELASPAAGSRTVGAAQKVLEAKGAGGSCCRYIAMKSQCWQGAGKALHTNPIRDLEVALDRLIREVCSKGIHAWGSCSTCSWLDARKLPAALAMVWAGAMAAGC